MQLFAENMNPFSQVNFSDLGGVYKISNSMTVVFTE